MQLVEDVAAAPVTTQGPQLERHPRFPNRVNAGYMQVRDRHRIALRVWERGAGETLSCGTGACAAVVAGMSRSGSTIIGGMLFGLDRRVATEFSFFLAIPIIFGATLYEMLKSWHTLTTDALGLFAVGLIAAFGLISSC